MFFDCLALLVILVMALGCSVYFDCKIGKMIPIVVSCIICVELVCGFFNHLEWGLYLLSLFMIFCIYSIAKNYKKIYLRLNANVIFVFIVAYVLLEIHHHNSIPSTWDELAAWAVGVRYSYMTNWFPAHVGSNSFYPDYPPATAMFHYFWMRIGNGWRDNRLYVSMGVLLVSYLVPVLDEIKIKQKKLGFLFIIDFILFFLPLSIYPVAYSDLKTDCIMGVIFAWVLYNVALEKDIRLKVSGAGLGCFVLMMTKTYAFGFVLLALAVWFGNAIQKKDKRQFFSMLWIFVIVIAEKFAWKLYIKSQGVPVGFSMRIPHPAIWQLNAFCNYFKALFDYSVVENTSQTLFWINGIKTPIAVFLAILIIVGIVLACKKREYKIINGILLFGVMGYVMVMSYPYLALFGEGEVAILSSMNRYLGTIFVGVALFFLYIFIYENTFSDVEKIFPIILLCFVPCFKPQFLFIRSFMAGYKVQVKNRVEQFSNLEKKADFIKMNVVDKSAKIHIFNGDIAGMNYILTPMRVTSPLWASGEFGLFEQFSHLYDYVWFDNLYGSIETDAFKEKYGHLFVIGSPLYKYGLYKVIYVDGLPRLLYTGKKGPVYD